MRPGVTLVLLSIAITACAPGPGRLGPEGALAGTSGHNDNRTLVISMRTEPKTPTRMTPGAQGISPKGPSQIFHAGLIQLDEKNTPHLQLAEGFPHLGTESWKVFPDGRMETTWRLRPNLTWHDGVALVADDFVTSRQFSKAAALPGDAGTVEEVVAPDPRTVVIRYKSLTPEAGESAMEPLARHILGPSLEQMDDARDARDALYGLPYFGAEFVGLGPYRLERWETGAFITGVAFPDYVLGKPKIGRVQLMWISDANAAVANLLAGTVHLATDLSIAFEQASVLKQEWAARGGPGSILLGAARTVLVQLQFKPEYVKPAAMLDVRFRQALAHGIDKQAIVDAVLDGEPGMADTLVAKEEDYYPELDRVLTKYPLDPGRANQLLSEMGFTKDGEGFHAQGSTRLSVGMIVAGGGGGYPREALILADGWKRAGIETIIRTLSATEQLDMEIGSTYPALRITQFQVGSLVNQFSRLNMASMATPERRWSGQNKGGYANPEFERLSDIYDASLDRNARIQATILGMKLVSEQAAILPLYYGYDIVAHGGSLGGPLGPRQDNAMWKIEEWYWK